MQASRSEAGGGGVGAKREGKKKRKENQTKSSRWPSERPPAFPRLRAVPGSDRPGLPLGGRRCAFLAFRGPGASLFVLLGVEEGSGWRRLGGARVREVEALKVLFALPSIRPLDAFLLVPYLVRAHAGPCRSGRRGTSCLRELEAGHAERRERKGKREKRLAMLCFSARERREK